MVDKINDFKDLIFSFREYTIQNEEDFQATLIDYQLSEELIELINSLKESILKDDIQFQISQFAFEFLLQAQIKNNINLLANIIAYSEENQNV